MSSLLILSIALVIAVPFLASPELIISANCLGTTCHDRPNLSRPATPAASGRGRHGGAQGAPRQTAALTNQRASHGWSRDNKHRPRPAAHPRRRPGRGVVDRRLGAVHQERS